MPIAPAPARQTRSRRLRTFSRLHYHPRPSSELWPAQHPLLLKGTILAKVRIFSPIHKTLIQGDLPCVGSLSKLVDRVHLRHITQPRCLSSHKLSAGRQQINHGGTEITENLWKSRLRVLSVSVVNDFRRSDSVLGARNLFSRPGLHHFDFGLGLQLLGQV